MMPSGPLKGLKIVELAGIGPGPFAGMMLGDMGADVVRVERRQAAGPQPDGTIATRGRRRIALDLKQPGDLDICLRLCDRAEIVFEGNRPGVMERLGLGPDVLLGRNPRLVYGRMTGWGQFGPRAPHAGHDINYLALTGALHAIGTADKPVPPLNLAADYGGGAMFLVAGMLAALIHARATGQGQVVDAAMTDGAAYLMTLFYGMFGTGAWQDRRAANMLDGGTPYYDTYRCSDAHWIAIGPLEPQFYAELLRKTGLEAALGDTQLDSFSWPKIRQMLASLFASRTRQAWCDLLEDSDACFAPVLSLAEAPNHPHNVARKTFVELDGVVQPAPAPRFSATPGRAYTNSAAVSADAAAILRDWDD